VTTDKIAEALRRLVVACERDLDTRRCAESMLRALNGARAALLTAQPEAVGEPTWRPIETAPKDGPAVLLGWFELPGMSGREVGFWHTRESAWCNYHRVLHNKDYPPTHWMPLPAPPTRHPTKEAENG
jgi:hypothetical protein